MYGPKREISMLYTVYIYVYVYIYIYIYMHNDFICNIYITYIYIYIYDCPFRYIDRRVKEKWRGEANTVFLEPSARQHALQERIMHRKGVVTGSQKIYVYLSIIPVRKWSVPPIYRPFRPFGRDPTTRSLGDLRSPWLLTTYVRRGMIFQVDVTAFFIIAGPKGEAVRLLRVNTNHG